MAERAFLRTEGDLRPSTVCHQNDALGRCVERAEWQVSIPSSEWFSCGYHLADLCHRLAEEGHWPLTLTPLPR